MKKSTVGKMSVFLITCVLMSVSSALVNNPMNGTYAIKGTVYISECPPDQMMKMPCLLKPAPGCSVTVYYNLTIYYGDPRYPKDQPAMQGKVGDPMFKDTLYYPPVSNGFTSKGVTDANGQFGIKFDTLLQKGSALTIVFGNQKDLFYVTGGEIDTMCLYLQNQPQQPITDPKLQTGYSMLAGYVTGADNVGVANAKVIIYRDKIVLDATVDPVKKDLLVSDTTATSSAYYSAITDANGWFAIYKILITMGPSSVLPPNVFYIEAVSGNKKAASKVELKIDGRDTVRLQLSGSTPEPIVNGISSLEGYVYTGSGLLTSDQKLLNTVPGCTLVVTNEITPSLSDYKMDVPPTFQGFYIAVTDSNGHFKIENIKIWTEGAPFIMMAQKDGRFATSNVSLYTQKTMQCSVVLGNIENNTVVDSVATPEMKFYNDNKELGTSSVKKLSWNTDKLLSGNFVSIASGRLTVNLKDAQRLTVAAYSLDGKLVNTICKDRNMTSGNHFFDMNAMRGSTLRMILKVTGENFSGSILLNPVIH